MLSSSALSGLYKLNSAGATKILNFVTIQRRSRWRERRPESHPKTKKTLLKHHFYTPASFHVLIPASHPQSTSEIPVFAYLSLHESICFLPALSISVSTLEQTIKTRASNSSISSSSHDAVTKLSPHDIYSAHNRHAEGRYKGAQGVTAS